MILSISNYRQGLFINLLELVVLRTEDLVCTFIMDVGTCVQIVIAERMQLISTF